jgi:hypothetical protein
MEGDNVWILVIAIFFTFELIPEKKIPATNCSLIHVLAFTGPNYKNLAERLRLRLLIPQVDFCLQLIRHLGKLFWFKIIVSHFK